MSIYHDAYLFDPKELAAALSPYLEALQKGEQGYLALRSEVSRLLDSSPQLQKLARDYGGWDKKGVLETTPEHYPDEQDDIGFLIMFLIYDKLFQLETHELGLGRKWETLAPILRLLGWNEADAKALIDGKSFKYFAQQWLNFDNEIVNDNESFWNYINPISTLGSAGWIGSASMDGFLNRIIEDEDKLATDKSNWTMRILSVSGLDIAEVTNAYEATKHMLATAKEAECDLCVIISG